MLTEESIQEGFFKEDEDKLSLDGYTVLGVVFPIEQGRYLEGVAIRSTDSDGSYIVGCRMPEDSIEIGNYVNRNYSE